MEIISGLEVVKALNPKSKTHIVILHGYGANAHDLYSLKNYFDPNSNYNWYFPNGFLKLEMSPVYESRAWFPIDIAAYEKAQSEGRHRDLAGVRPAGLNEARDRLLKFINAIVPDGESLLLGGFSQGAMLSTELSFQVKNCLKGLIVLSGAVVDEKTWAPGLKELNGIPYIQSHGQQDAVLSYDEAVRLSEILDASGLSGEFIGFSGGHEIPMPVVEKVKKFITTNA